MLCRGGPRQSGFPSGTPCPSLDGIGLNDPRVFAYRNVTFVLSRHIFTRVVSCPKLWDIIKTRRPWMSYYRTRALLDDANRLY